MSTYVWYSESILGKVFFFWLFIFYKNKRTEDAWPSGDFEEYNPGK